VLAPNAASLAAIEGRLRAWGRLKLVTPPDEGDLVLEVRRVDPLVAYSDVRDESGGGATFAARLTYRASQVEVWSTTKGGSWPLSDWQGSWAGKAIADEFIRYFDKARRADGTRRRDWP
jgi:hypothetical protein